MEAALEVAMQATPLSTAQEMTAAKVALKICVREQKDDTRSEDA